MNFPEWIYHNYMFKKNSILKKYQIRLTYGIHYILANGFNKTYNRAEWATSLSGPLSRHRVPRDMALASRGSLSIVPKANISATRTFYFQG